MMEVFEISSENSGGRQQSDWWTTAVVDNKCVRQRGTSISVTVRGERFVGFGFMRSDAH